MLPSGQQVRTLLPATTAASQRASSEPPSSSYDALWSHVVGWSITEYESYADLLDSDANIEAGSSESLPPSSPRENANDLVPSLLYTTLTSLLSLSDALPDNSQASEIYALGPTLSFTREDAAQYSSTSSNNVVDRAKGRLALLDGLARLVAKDWRRVEEERVLEGRQRRKKEQILAADEDKNLGSRLERLELAVLGDGRTAQGSNAAGVAASTVTDLEADIEELVRRVEALERERAGLSTASSVGKPRRRVRPLRNDTATAGQQASLNLVVLLLTVLVGLASWAVLGEKVGQAGTRLGL